MKHNLTEIAHKNNFYKRFLIFTLLSLLTNIAFAATIAYDYTYNGLSLRYNLDTDIKTAICVGLTDGGNGSGSLEIPAFVEYNGERYSVTEIGEEAFYNRYRFTGSLTIPDSVTEIGKYAFYGCSSLKGTLTLGNSVTEIGTGAFVGCSGFTGSLTIPDSVIEIGTGAFSGCSGLTGLLTIGNSVTKIGDSAFNDCSGFTGSLTIPDSVTEIGDYAFSACSGFTGTLTIPDSVIEIGQYAFFECSGFTGSLRIPDSVTKIGNKAFSNCSRFTGSLTIPNSVMEIGEWAFQECSGFTGLLTLGNSVTEIGSYAFIGCSGFTGSLTIPNSVTKIGNQAFSNCSGFTGLLTIGNSVMEIGTGAFQYCSGFTGSLTIPDLVTKIGWMAFYGCSGFTGTLILGNSVTKIEESAFQYCSGFTGSLSIPDSVTEIGYYAFSGCSGFNGSLIIGNSVTSIGSSSFSECSGFTGSLIIGNSVATIGASAFNSTKFEKIESYNNNPPICSSYCFNNYNIPLYVPINSIELYEGADVWKNFSYIGFIPGSEIEAESITFNTSNLELTIGQTSQLTATVYPENTTDKNVTWKSNNPGVASVGTDGTITAVSVGTTTITASCGTATATCKVTVSPVKATGITLSVESLTMTIGQTSRLTATVYPENTTDKTMTWKSDNPGVATVGTDGTVTAVSVGTATITASCRTATATCKVTVSPVKATGITLNVESLTMTIGQTSKLTATVYPENTADKTVTWKSDNPGVATVGTDGTVTAVSAGTANITAISGEATATCPIKVNPIVATGVTLNFEALTLTIGQTSKLTATVTPENVTDKTVTWSSDNPSVATVRADGTVTAVSVGIANIRATYGNITASCRVTVNPVVASGVLLSMEAMTLTIGQTNRLTATILPDNTTDKTVTWSSDNTGVATVGADGTVTAVSVGTANIKGTIGDASAICKVTVNPVTATGLTLNVEAMGLILGESSKLTATVLPDNVTDKTVIWSSDNPAVATVGADGTVTAVGKGSANIIASNGNVTAICRVTVGLPQVIGINLSPLTMTLSPGETGKFNAAFVPAASETNLTWTSDDPSIVEVSPDGTVTATGYGTAIIYATSANGVTGVATVKVSDNRAVTVSITPQDLVLTLGEKTQLKAEINPEGGASQITWSSRDASIVSVDSEGYITATGTGATVIYARTENGVTGVATVTVIDGNQILSITVSPEILNLGVGGETQLKVVTQPVTASQEIRWLSSDTSVAEVSESGVVTAISPGVAIIYAMTENGLTGFSTVNVVENIVTSIMIDPDDLYMELDETAQLTATLLPLGVEAALTWTSTDTTVATVDNSGVVTAKEPGYTFIYATSANGVTGLSMVRVIDPTTGDFDPGHGYGENGVYISAIRIREGDPLGLFAERPLNFENNDWTYEWYLNNQLEAEGKYAVVTAGEPSGWTGTQKSTNTEQYQVDIYNIIGDEILLDLPQVTVYSRPITPLELLKKGDGETSSFIAISNLSDTELANLGYSFVFGYTDGEGVNHIISNSTLRYCHTSKNIYDNPQYRFWVFTTWTFPDGATITSGLRYLDGTLDENFDRSDFNFSRTGSIEGLEGEIETRIYTLSGNMVGKEADRLAPGIYIIVERQGKQISTRKIIKR